MKPAVIFIHVLKCGGTSMKYMLFEEYGVSYFHPEPVSTLTGVMGYPMLRGVDALTWQKQINVDTAHYYGCIAGHYDWGLAERLPDWDVIVMLRDPVEQLRSLYQYLCASIGELGEISIWMQSLGFEGWVKSEHVKPYLNAQTVYLSGHHVRDVDIAMQNLFSERVTFGLVEQYGESIRRFNAKFGWTLSEQHHMRNDRFELSDETWALAQALQLDDLTLWAEATAVFNEKQIGETHE